MVSKACCQGRVICEAGSSRQIEAILNPGTRLNQFGCNGFTVLDTTANTIVILHLMLMLEIQLHAYYTFYVSLPPFPFPSAPLLFMC